MQRASSLFAVTVFVLGIWVASPSSSAFAADDAQAQVHISGRVTDFQNLPIAGASVELKDARFETVAKATSDPDGRYVLTAPKGHYMALLAVRDYQVKFLEYWAWNVLADEDLEINPRFDCLEVYGMNAWRPQGAYPSYQIYFRPMSLARAGTQIAAAGSMEAFGKLPLMDIAPVLNLEDIAVAIDGQPVTVLRVNKVLEAAGPKQDMIGYVIQTQLPTGKTSNPYSIITITLTDRETGEKGEGSLFLDLAR
jgi:hypothetical protein